ncbi:MAG: hypothetical protein HY520_01280 [Candidatus Aenigmarchaeota archaeon]|nr:hypothetical protein [Candidatus Aenigmarchaeota archaeon]
MMGEPKAGRHQDAASCRGQARRGQIWSFDFAVSLTIFLTVLVLVLFFWIYANVQSFDELAQDELQDHAIAVSDILVRSAGVPSGWTNASVEVIGLASQDKVLDPRKVRELALMDYNQTRRLLGIGRYDFQLEIWYPNGTLALAQGLNASAGLAPQNASIVSPVDRFVIYEGQVARMRFLLWAPAD